MCVYVCMYVCICIQRDYFHNTYIYIYIYNYAVKHHRGLELFVGFMVISCLAKQFLLNPFMNAWVEINGIIQSA